MTKKKRSVWPWHPLTRLILLVLAWALWFFISSISYEWRWNRAPQYFVYQAEEPLRTNEIGRVEVIREQDRDARVALLGESGGKQVATVAQDSLQFSEGDDVAEGDAAEVARHWAAGPLLWGLWTTPQLSPVSDAVGLAIGLVAGLCRSSKDPTLYDLSTIYVELVRGTSLLMQVFIFYFFIGTVFGLSREFVGVAAPALFTGAYVAGIIRAGMQSITRGQNEAARSLGLNADQSMCYMILPQALKRVLPPLAEQPISLVKDILLVSVIVITELTKSGRKATTTSLSTSEIWFYAAALYLLLNLLLSHMAS